MDITQSQNGDVNVEDLCTEQCHYWQKHVRTTSVYYGHMYVRKTLQVNYWDDSYPFMTESSISGGIVNFTMFYFSLDKKTGNEIKCKICCIWGCEYWVRLMGFFLYFSVFKFFLIKKNYLLDCKIFKSWNYVLFIVLSIVPNTLTRI